MPETETMPDISTLDTGDNKHHVEHHDDIEADKRAAAYVADTDAAEYVNPDLIIDEVENKRLRRLIHKKWEQFCHLRVLLVGTQR